MIWSRPRSASAASAGSARASTSATRPEAKNTAKDIKARYRTTPPPATGDLTPHANSPRNYIALLSQGIYALGTSALEQATGQMDRAIRPFATATATTSTQKKTSSACARDEFE